MLDFSLFEPLYNTQPFALIAEHPTEPFVALAIAFDKSARLEHREISSIHLAIWNSETYKLVKAFEDVVTVAWDVDGSGLGLVYKQEAEYDLYHGDEDTDFHTYAWEYLSWPGQELLTVCDLTLVTSSPECLVFSPAGDLAIVQWFEVDKTGLEFIDIVREGESQPVDIGVPRIQHESDEPDSEEDLRFFVDTNLATRPVFSPDGRYIVFGWQRRQRWWSDVPDDAYVEGELPARVGECLVGYVQVVDGEENTTHELAIFVNLPPGWQPSYERDRSNELLPDPVFVDNEHFQLFLPTGETRAYSVREGR